jgi:flagellin-like protein
MEVENDMIKSRRSKRGLSPIFATLILIAIAVIAGIVVYAFVSGAIPGLVSGPGAGSEKVAVQSANGFTNGTVTVLYQWTGGAQPTINSVLLRNSAGVAIGTYNITTAVTPTTVGTLYSIPATFGAGLMSAGNTYSVALISNAGGNFDSPSFAAATP